LDIDLTNLKEPVLTLKDIKYDLYKHVEKMDLDTKEDAKYNRDMITDIGVQTRVLLDLGKYSCLRELYFDIMGVLPSDAQIRSWKEEFSHGNK